MFSFVTIFTMMLIICISPFLNMAQGKSSWHIPLLTNDSIPANSEGVSSNFKPNDGLVPVSSVESQGYLFSDFCLPLFLLGLDLENALAEILQSTNPIGFL